MESMAEALISWASDSHLVCGSVHLQAAWSVRVSKGENYRQGGQHDQHWCRLATAKLTVRENIVSQWKILQCKCVSVHYSCTSLKTLPDYCNHSQDLLNGRGDSIISDLWLRGNFEVSRTNRKEMIFILGLWLSNGSAKPKRHWFF